MTVTPAFRRGLAALSLVCLIGAPAALAQSAPIQRGITSADLAEQTQRLQRANADLRAELGNLQSELASLNGRVETLEFLLSQSRDEIERMRGDDREIGRQLSDITSRLDGLAARLDRLEAGQLSQASPVANDEAGVSAGSGTGDGDGRSASPDASGAGSESATLPDPLPSGEPGQTGYLGTLPAEDLPGESGELFSLAKSRLLQFDYQGAEVAFRAFLDRFGDDPQAGEALYWLGEVLYQQEAYRESGSAYTDLIRTYPDDPRAPDALVKLARSMRLVGEPGRACTALDALDQRYPDASGVTKNLAAVERTRAGCDS